MTMRVLMVCTGNICRSVMAHQMLEETARAQGLELVVDSAGVSDEERGNPVDRRAARALREGGYRVPNHRARQIQPGELGRWDLILAMTGNHLRAVERLLEREGVGDSGRGVARPVVKMFREFDPRVSAAAAAAVGAEADSAGADHGQNHPLRNMDMPDPWYGDYSDFLETRDTIERSLPALMDYIRRRGEGSEE